MRDPFEKILGQYWYCLQAASGRLAYDVDWLQEAKALLWDLHKTWLPQQGLDFEDHLFAIVRREADNYYYRHVKRHPMFLDVSEIPVQAVEPDFESLDRLWLKIKVHNLLQANVRYSERVVLQQYFYRNQTKQAIAQSLNIDRTTVSMRINRGLERLKGLPEVSHLIAVLA